MKLQKKSDTLVSISSALEGMEDFFEQQESKYEHSIWAEPQLYLLPLCVPQDRNSERFRQIKISESVRVNDEITYRSFKVNPDPDLGLPGSFELDVMTGIYFLADRLKKQIGFVPDFIDLGSLKSFLELIGKPYSGRYAKMLKEALRRLMSTTCISEGFFYSKPRDLYIVESFTFISGLEIAGELDLNSGIRYEKTRIKLHEFIRENLNSNFRMLIDFDYIKTLRTDIAKPVALHIIYRIFKNGKGEWIADYEWLAGRIGVKLQPTLRRAKEQLKAAFTELKATQLIESWEWMEPNRIKFFAGLRLLEMHKRRVAAKDAFIEFQQEQARIDRLITNKSARTILEAEKQEAFDPLAALCADFAYRGWDATIARKAKSRGLSREALIVEAQNRGHQVYASGPLG